MRGYGQDLMLLQLENIDFVNKSIVKGDKENNLSPFSDMIYSISAQQIQYLFSCTLQVLNQLLSSYILIQ